MREFSHIKEKILQYLDYKGISKYKFYQETGITNGILSQSNGLSEENTLKFLNYYRDISAEWLLRGEGSMLKNGIDPSEKSLENTQIGADESDNKAIQTLKDIIKEQACDIARLEMELERLKAGAGNALNVATA